MTTKKSQKSKKYVLTKLVRTTPNMFSTMTEKQIGRFDSLEQCAEFIVKNDEYWYICRYGKEIMNAKLSTIIIKLKSLNFDFM